MTTYKSNFIFLFTSFLVTATVITIFTVVPAWAGKGQGPDKTTLSEAEAVELTYMREEEKLARDVYLLMSELWGASIFDRIATSEQRHMDTMRKMVDKYQLPDPALPEKGLFTNTFLQTKYYELVDIGDNSYVDGLYVGATIEEIDMIDIMHAIDVTYHVDVVNTYQHLLEGSKNHLRAYVKALASQEVMYSPQFISQELFDAIIGLSSFTTRSECVGRGFMLHGQ